MIVAYDWEFIDYGEFKIEPISVGMVREDGETYYAELMAPDDSWPEWLKENVAPKLNGRISDRETVAREIRNFVGTSPVFLGYYSAYEHYLLYSINGPMVDSPPGWPHWTIDLIQIIAQSGIDPRKSVVNRLEHHALSDAIWTYEVYTKLVGKLNGTHKI